MAEKKRETELKGCLKKMDMGKQVVKAKTQKTAGQLEKFKEI